MRLFLTFFSFLFLPLSLLASFPPEMRAKVAYLMYKGECEKALTSYLDFAKENNAQDFELLQRSALSLLEMGIQSSDAETRLLSLFGAGISLHREALSILSRGIESDDLRMQMVALSFLEKYHDDEASEIVQKALSSPFLLPRLEAAYILAKSGDRKVVDHLASLYEKVPDPVRPLFSEILVESNDGAAEEMLKRLLADSRSEVRVAAVTAVGDGLRDEFISKIRLLAMQGDFRVEEAAAYTLGKLKDSQSKEKLQLLANKKCETTRIAALDALGELGEEEVNAKMREEHSLFALAPLAKKSCNIDLFKEWAKNDDFTLRINAALPLLKEGVMPPLALLKEILLAQEKDMGFHEVNSPGGALSYFRPVPSLSGQDKRYPRLNVETQLFKVKHLRAALALSEEDFLTIAKMIVVSRTTDLTLPLMELMIQRETEKGTALLKEMADKAGAPFLRLAATLALYRITEEDEYEKRLINWLTNYREQPLIRFKKEEMAEKSLHSPYTLTPEETSELLIATLETLAQTRKISGIEALMGAMAYGNPKNRYALAGLLMKATE